MLLQISNINNNGVVMKNFFAFILVVTISTAQASTENCPSLKGNYSCTIVTPSYNNVFRADVSFDQVDNGELVSYLHSHATVPDIASDEGYDTGEELGTCSIEGGFKRATFIPHIPRPNNSKYVFSSSDSAPGFMSAVFYSADGEQYQIWSCVSK
jgi:hypothetical protein